jgi:hypothetical protein
VSGRRSHGPEGQQQPSSSRCLYGPIISAAGAAGGEIPPQAAAPPALRGPPKAQRQVHQQVCIKLAHQLLKALLLAGGALDPQEAARRGGVFCGAC